MQFLGKWALPISLRNSYEKRVGARPEIQTIYSLKRQELTNHKSIYALVFSMRKCCRKINQKAYQGIQN
jgi:hypothetical protein